jgi:hypothetical protein
VVVHTCNSNYSGSKGWEDPEFKVSLGKVSKTLFQKQKCKQKVGVEGGRTQVVCKVLGSRKREIPKGLLINLLI